VHKEYFGWDVDNIRDDHTFSNRKIGLSNYLWEHCFLQLSSNDEKMLRGVLSVLYRNITFRKLDLFPSSVEGLADTCSLCFGGKNNPQSLDERNISGQTGHLVLHTMDVRYCNEFKKKRTSVCQIVKHSMEAEWMLGASKHCSLYLLASPPPLCSYELRLVFIPSSWTAAGTWGV
jgi:hypothetical protein